MAGSFIQGEGKIAPFLRVNWEGKGVSQNQSREKVNGY
jgi:hypothetical protein